MLDNILNQGFYRIKKREILEKARFISEHFDNFYLQTCEITSMLKELNEIALLDDNALLLHKRFIDSDDYQLIHRLLIMIAFLQDSNDMENISNLAYEMEKTKNWGKIKQEKNSIVPVQINLHTKMYEDKKGSVLSKITILKLLFYSYLKDSIDFGKLFKELTEKACNEALVLDFNKTVLANEDVVSSMRILSSLMFVAQPTEENIDLLLANVKLILIEEQFDIFKKIK